MLAGTYFKTIAVAAQVAWINESKGRVHINGGKNNGFIPGATVCFFISSAEKFVCGMVKSASDSKAVVKVNKRWAKKMKKRMEAMLYIEKEERKELKEKEDKEEIKENFSPRSMGIHDEVWHW
jgi:hypothetical protein